MKVLHIAPSDSGGAGKGMLNLHKALLDAGIESKILVRDKQTNYPEIYTAEPNINLYKWSKFQLVRYFQIVFRWLGISYTKMEKIQRRLLLTA